MAVSDLLHLMVPKFVDLMVHLRVRGCGDLDVEHGDVRLLTAEVLNYFVPDFNY